MSISKELGKKKDGNCHPINSTPPCSSKASPSFGSGLFQAHWIYFI